MSSSIASVIPAAIPATWAEMSDEPSSTRGESKMSETLVLM